MNENDKELLIKAMQRMGGGDFSRLDVSAFEDQGLAKEFNSMVKGVSDRNNTFLARINDAMSRIGDNRVLKELLDAMQVQRESLNVMSSTKDKLSFSIRRLEDYGYEMLALSRQIRNTCEPCVEDMHSSYKDVNSLIDDMMSGSVPLFK